MNVNIALLTVTDTRTLKTDKSGNILVDKISKANHNLVDRKICKDSKKAIKKILKNWIKKKRIDVIKFHPMHQLRHQTILVVQIYIYH